MAVYSRQFIDVYGILDEDVCPCCKKTEDSLDNAKEYFELLIKMLHSKEMINPHSLAMLLEEIDAYCGFKCAMPAHLPTVQVVAADPMTVYPINRDLI
jgi:hypothetical protein